MSRRSPRNRRRRCTRRNRHRRPRRSPTRTNKNGRQVNANSSIPRKFAPEERLGRTTSKNSFSRIRRRAKPHPRRRRQRRLSSQPTPMRSTQHLHKHTTPHRSSRTRSRLTRTHARSRRHNRHNRNRHRRHVTRAISRTRRLKASQRQRTHTFNLAPIPPPPSIHQNLTTRHRRQRCSKHRRRRRRYNVRSRPMSNTNTTKFRNTQRTSQLVRINTTRLLTNLHRSNQDTSNPISRVISVNINRQNTNLKFISRTRRVINSQVTTCNSIPVTNLINIIRGHPRAISLYNRRILQAMHRMNKRNVNSQPRHIRVRVNRSRRNNIHTRRTLSSKLMTFIHTSRNRILHSRRSRQLA